MTDRTIVVAEDLRLSKEFCLDGDIILAVDSRNCPVKITLPRPSVSLCAHVVVVHDNGGHHLVTVCVEDQLFILVRDEKRARVTFNSPFERAAFVCAPSIDAWARLDTRPLGIIEGTGSSCPLDDLIALVAAVDGFSGTRLVLESTAVTSAKPAVSEWKLLIRDHSDKMLIDVTGKTQNEAFERAGDLLRAKLLDQVAMAEKTLRQHRALLYASETDRAK